jgi:ribonuclease HI
VRATLNTDGASRHKTGESTGPAGIGAVLHSESGEIIGEIASGIGLATNNVAEYTALVEGLQMALDAGVTDIEVSFDSPVLAGHHLKGHRVKADHLRPLVERARQLLDLFSTSSLARVPRGLNAHADKLANQGIDAVRTPSAQLPN